MTTATFEPPTTEAPALPAPEAERPRPGIVVQLLRDSAYLLLALPMGILTFTVAVAGWSTAISTLLTFIGVPVAVLTIGALRLLARAERHRAAIVLGEPVAEHYKVDLPVHKEDWRSLGVIWTWFKGLFDDRQMWRDLLYALLLLPVAIIDFTVIALARRHDGRLHHVPRLVVGAARTAGRPASGTSTRGPTPAILAGVGDPADPGRGAARARHRRRVGVARLRAAAADAPRARAPRRAPAGDARRRRRRGAAGARADRARPARRRAGAAGRRRDGARAAPSRSCAPATPTGAATLVGEAREDTQRALAELRDLARGIRPALLSERGLREAITSLAARAGRPDDRRLRPRRPGADRRRDGRVLRRRRGAGERRQARRGLDRRRARRAPRDPAGDRDPRRRPRRRQPRGQRPHRPAQARRGARRHPLPLEPRRRARPSCERSCHARRDRRGPRAAARRADAACWRTTAARSSPPSRTPTRSSRPSSASVRTSASSTSGSRRRSATRGSAARSPRARSSTGCRSSSSRSTSSGSSPRSCSPTGAAASATS